MKIIDRTPFVTLAIVLYTASLFLPSLECISTNAMAVHYGGYDGWWLLLFGWFGLLIWEPRWLLNLVFFLFTIHLLVGKTWKLLVLPIFAALAALSLFLLPAKGYCGEMTSPVALKIGAFLWIASIVIISFNYLYESIKTHPDV